MSFPCSKYLQLQVHYGTMDKTSIAHLLSSSVVSRPIHLEMYLCQKPVVGFLQHGPVSQNVVVN